MSGEEWNDNQNHTGRESNSNPNDVSNALKKQVDVSDDGKLKVFGKEFDVGKNGALIVRPLVDLAISQLSVRGAATATRFGTGLSKVIMPQRWAAKIGKTLGFIWLFGLSASDVALGVKKTVNDGFKDMHELRDKWEPLLAANHNMDTSVSKALSNNCGVLCHARARVYEKGKRELLATIAGGVRALPTILMGIYQYHADNIAHPDRVELANTHKNMSLQEQEALDQLVQKLESKKITKKQLERMHNSNDDLIGTVSKLFTDPKVMRRMRNPQNEYDYRRNIKSLTLMPPIFGVGSELIERHITKKNNTSDADAGDKILEMQAFVHNHDQPDRERLIVQIRDIFQQRAKDLDRKYTLEGDTFDRTCEAVADAVLTGLHPQAVAEILDNRKVVTFGVREADFGDSQDLKVALDALKQKYTKKVSEKQFYKDAPFTKETLAKAFHEMPENEKPFFVMLFPVGILEKTGVSKAEVKKYRDKGKEFFVDDLLKVTKGMINDERDDLKKRGVKSKAISEFEAFKETYRRAESNDHGDAFLEKDPEKAARIIRDVTLSAKNPKELWQEYLKKRSEETAACLPAQERKGMDHLADDKTKGSSLPAK